MNAEALDLWGRAHTTLRTASSLTETDPDSAASRAYYAAFYAVSALFTLDERVFSKHSALESAVHKDLVKSGRWPKDLGVDYSRLLGLRARGDYGVYDHVTKREAKDAVLAAGRILRAVYEARSREFQWPERSQMT